MRRLCLRKNLALKNRRFRRRLVAEIVPTLSTPCVAQGGAVVPVGRDGMLGDLAETFAGMKEVDCLLVGPELPEKRPVVGRGDGDQRRAALSG